MIKTTLLCFELPVDPSWHVYAPCHHGSVEILLNSGSHLNKVAMELSIRKIRWSQLCQGIGFGSFRGDFASQSVLWSWKFKLFVTFSWRNRKPLGPVHHGNWRHLGEHICFRQYWKMATWLVTSLKESPKWLFCLEDGRLVLVWKIEVPVGRTSSFKAK